MSFIVLCVSLLQRHAATFTLLLFILNISMLTFVLQFSLLIYYSKLLCSVKEAGSQSDICQTLFNDFFFFAKIHKYVFACL